MIGFQEKDHNKIKETNKYKRVTFLPEAQNRRQIKGTKTHNI